MQSTRMAATHNGTPTTFAKMTADKRRPLCVEKLHNTTIGSSEECCVLGGNGARADKVARRRQDRQLIVVGIARAKPRCVDCTSEGAVRNNLQTRCHTEKG